MRRENKKAIMRVDRLGGFVQTDASILADF